MADNEMDYMYNWVSYQSSWEAIYIVCIRIDLVSLLLMRGLRFLALVHAILN